MNGATALPFANTMSAPNTAIINKIGMSQNFRRSRMNPQSSVTNSTMMTSELLGHGMTRGSRRPSIDPVRLRCAVEPQAQWVLADRAKQQTDRRDGREVHQPEHDRTDTSVQQ